MERAWCRGISEDVEVQVSSVILETWEVFLVASACCVLEPREPDGVSTVRGYRPMPPVVLFGIQPSYHEVGTGFPTLLLLLLTAP